MMNPYYRVEGIKLERNWGRNNDRNVSRKISIVQTVKEGVDPMELGIYV